MAKAARVPYTYNPTYISKTIAYNTPGVGLAANISVGKLPAGALHTSTIVRIKTAFNAGTTNVLIVGTSADDDYFIEAGDVDETATGATISDRNVGAAYSAATEVFVKFTETGTAATTGEAEIVLNYIAQVEA